jgi:cystathionine gamma-synthase/methionine-gamma-lyase
MASQDLYGATLRLLHETFDSFGVRTVIADFNDIESLKRLTNDAQPRALLTETISNTLLKVCDIKACAEVAHAAGARLIVDNTFASPYLCQPLTLGADFSVHSATKYLGGHCDATGGIVVVRDEWDIPALISTMKLVGGVLGVWDAHEILRGIKTLGLRMERQCANARRIAERFAAHERIKRIFYPCLKEGTSDASASNTTLHAGYGGALVTIALTDDTREAAFRFMDNLRLCVRSTSLGDVFTGVLHPATASHRDLSPAQRARLGIGDGLVRISVGIEDVNDIIADIEQALSSSERI